MKTNWIKCNVNVLIWVACFLTAIINLKAGNFSWKLFFIFQKPVETVNTIDISELKIFQHDYRLQWRKFAKGLHFHWVLDCNSIWIRLVPVYIKTSIVRSAQMTIIFAVTITSKGIRREGRNARLPQNVPRRRHDRLFIVWASSLLLYFYTHKQSTHKYVINWSLCKVFKAIKFFQTSPENKKR